MYDSESESRFKTATLARLETRLRWAFLHCLSNLIQVEEKGKLEANAMKRVAAGAHLPIPWFSEPAKRPDDRAYR